MTDKLENPLNKSIFFGCDMLEFTIFSLKHDTYFKDYWLLLNLNTTNTQLAYIDLFDMTFTYHKIQLKGYDFWLQFSLVIDWLTVYCFTLCFWTDIFNWKSRSSDKVVLYSSFFILEKLWKLTFTLNEFYNTLFKTETCKLYRLDLALDLKTDIKELQNTIFNWIRFFSQIWEDKKHPEFSQTYYIKNPQSCQNRRYLIRIYDKILDTFKKQKGFLYPHLINNYDVRRIELELRPIICKKYHNKDISYLLTNKDDLLYNIYIEYLNDNINQNYKLNFDDIPKVPEPNKQVFDLKTAYLQLWHIPKDYISQAYWYIKTIKNTVWYPWLYQLLSKWTKFLDWKNIEWYQPLKNLTESLEELIKYMINEWISQKLIRKIIIKNLPKPKPIKYIPKLPPLEIEEYEPVKFKTYFG